MILNARFLTQRVTGVQRFAREIIMSAAEHRLFGNTVKLVAPNVEEVPDSFAGMPVQRLGRHKGHIWEQLELLRVDPGSLLVNLCSTAPMGRRRQIVALHDASVAVLPQNFTFAFRAWYQVMIRAYGYHARKIVTVSEFSAREIVRHFGLKAAKIEIVSESGEHILRAAADYSLHEKFGLEQDGYFLAVSSVAQNKNFTGVLKAVARLPKLPFRFVIVGGRNDRVFSSTDLRTATEGAIETGYVTDGQLRALYERAACFVYPSLYEGFGLPPLEAMSCGCPVLVSETASMPEVCGDGALYCDPHDIEDIAMQLSRLLENSGLRAEFREAGLKRAREWTWRAAAQRLLDVAKAADQA